MRNPLRKKPVICCITAAADSGLITPILDALQNSSLKVLPICIDSIKTSTEHTTDNAILKSADVVIFFASVNSVNSTNTLPLINYAIKAYKRILTIYLEDCSMPEGLHLILDSYQAILWQNTDDNEQAYAALIQFIYEHFKNQQKPLQYSTKSFRTSIILFIIAVGIAVIPLLQILPFDKTEVGSVNSTASLSPEDYAKFFDTTEYPDKYAIAFFDMAQIGGERTYKNLWDRFVAEKVKKSGCTTEEKWLALWNDLDARGFDISDTRVMSTTELSPDYYKVTVELHFNLDGKDHREIYDLFIVLENDICKYLDGEPVSTDYLEQAGASIPEENTSSAIGTGIAATISDSYCANHQSPLT